MVKKLKADQEIGSSQLIKLIIKFYALYLINYNSITDFSSQL
jgi:hypothetical protein